MDRRVAVLPSSVRLAPGPRTPATARPRVRWVAYPWVDRSVPHTQPLRQEWQVDTRLVHHPQEVSRRVRPNIPTAAGRSLRAAAGMRLAGRADAHLVAAA